MPWAGGSRTARTTDSSVPLTAARLPTQEGDQHHAWRIW
jgi:hypothetical protein